MRVLPTLACGLLLLACGPAAAQAASAHAAAAAVPACPANASVMDGWNDRAPPRRIFANTWYVGTCGISAILIADPHGLVLIDGTTEAGAVAVEANIRALGFKLSDIKAILGSHEHADHAGGLARLQRDSGAPVLALAAAARTLRRGASDRDDPQFGQLSPYPAVAQVQVIDDGYTVQVGALQLTMHATPGHAPGSTSWTWRSCDGAHCVDIAYVDSVSAPTDGHYRHAEHPEYLAAFRHSLDVIAALPCDLLLTPHPLASDLFARLDGKAALIDPNGCKIYADDARKSLAQRLQTEADAARP